MINPTGGSFSFSLGSVGGTWRWSVYSSNLLGPSSSYQVQDIMTPYGPMNAMTVPLPADVVTAMAQSITDVRNQLKPVMTLISVQTSYSLSVTEGDPRENVGVAQIRNDGNFGSFLSVVATPNVPWLSVLTPEITGIARGEVANINFDIIPDNMEFINSPYTGQIRIQDANDSSSFVLITVNVMVLPRPEISVSSQDVTFGWSFSAPAPVSYPLTITNSGPTSSSLDFQISKLSGVPWLTISPETGGPISAGDSSVITLGVPGSSIPILVGEYVETVSVYSSNASNSPFDITVKLVVSY